MEIYRMKKSLFAVAAMTAVAGAAQAQSSVTVYGILDVGYIGSNATNVSKTNSLTAKTKTQTSQFGASAEQSSRLGFRGVEDLGGGTSAFFTVELGLAPASANLSGGSTVTDSAQGTTQGSGSAIDNRQSFLGLRKKGIGQGAFGRQYTPVFNAAAATDVGQLNNVIGNALYVGTSTYSSNDAGNGNGIAFTNRASNALTAKSDNFGGFTVSGLYALQNKNDTQLMTSNSSGGGGNTNWNGYGLGVDFSWQKLYVAAAYQSFKTQYTNGIYASSSTIYNLNGAAATSGQLSSTGALFAPSNLTDKQTYVAGTYDFGILKAYAGWVGRKVQQDTASAQINGNAASGTTVAAGQQANRTAQQIGVRSYITPAIESWASIGSGKYTGAVSSAGVTPASVSFVSYQLGTNYYLSKRTNLYAIYGQTNSTSASSLTAGSGSSANQYALGLRHTF
jgi:predicted porin